MKQYTYNIFKIDGFFYVLETDFDDACSMLKEQHHRTVKKLRKELFDLVIEQVDLAQENWDSSESLEQAFDTLRDCIRAQFQPEEK